MTTRWLRLRPENGGAVIDDASYNFYLNHWNLLEYSKFPANSQGNKVTTDDFAWDRGAYLLPLNFFLEE